MNLDKYATQETFDTVLIEEFLDELNAVSYEDALRFLKAKADYYTESENGTPGLFSLPAGRGRDIKICRWCDQWDAIRENN